MMAQMQAAQSGGNSADGSVQVGINLQKMMEGQKAAAAENLEVFGVEKSKTSLPCVPERATF